MSKRNLVVQSDLKVSSISASLKASATGQLSENCNFYDVLPEMCEAKGFPYIKFCIAVIAKNPIKDNANFYPANLLDKMPDSEFMNTFEHIYKIIFNYDLNKVKAKVQQRVLTIPPCKSDKFSLCYVISIWYGEEARNIQDVFSL